ncbi:toll/interleukin-1 receptor domain-containing protein [Crocinitomicaceae bacterium]|nr:toll/interleukin-1 receptor domain-containing protein [Crocinitomicaceae bacterium]
MKIFISHASANKAYGNALVQLLRGLDVPHEEIIFTSNVAYGIPNGKNIFNWLKDAISEKPYVIYLLSNQYYESVACLNEMGAAWVVENEHTVIFTPKFDIQSPQFQNGALDPREIGFYINDEDRLLVFIEQLKKSFNITSNSVVTNQKVKAFLQTISEISKVEEKSVKEKVPTKKKEVISNPLFDLISADIFAAEPEKIDTVKTQPTTKETTVKKDSYERITKDIRDSKLKDEELILIHYAIDTSRVRLMTGWQEESEIDNIKEWEDINNINNAVSSRYGNILRRFELRKYTEVSQTTGSGNPKEVKFNSEIEDNILDLPEDILKIIEDAVNRNSTEELPF